MNFFISSFSSKSLLTLLFTFLCMMTMDSAQARSGTYKLATASKGGTYYPVGVALSTLSQVKLMPKQRIRLTAVNSAGSGENIQLLKEGKVEFAFLDGLYGYYAWNAKGPMENQPKHTHLRAVTLLWESAEQFIINSDHVKSGTISDFLDLKGQSAALGNLKSGTLGSNNALLSQFGLNIKDDFTLLHGGYAFSTNALLSGDVTGISTPAGVPTGAINKLMATMKGKAHLLNFTDQQMEVADGGKKLWSRFVIPANTYPNQINPVNTIAQPNFMAVHADVSEDHVYKITKAIYENLPFLNAIHPATDTMSLESATKNLPVPLHPGAIKYFKEAGLVIPSHLLP